MKLGQVKYWGAEARVETPQADGPIIYKDKLGEEYEFARVEGGIAHLPRNMVPRQSGDIPPIGQVQVRFKNHFSAYNECQKKMVPRLHVKAGRGEDFIVEAATGVGKTYIGTTLAAELGMRTLIVVPKTDLKKQWLKAIRDVMHLSSQEVGTLQGGVCDLDHKISIGMLQSIWKPERYESWVYRHFGLLVFDEIHLCGAELFGQACLRFNSRQRIGLSATVKRRDGRERFFQAHCGEVAATWEGVPMTPKVFYRRTGYRLPAWARNFNPAQMGHVMKLLIQADRRVWFAGRDVKTLYEKKRITLVLCHNIDGLKRIEQELLSLGVEKKEIGWYIGGKSEAQLDIAKRRPIILATVKMMGFGTDIPWIDAVLLFTPMSQVKQTVGRGLREHPGKPQPVVIDYLDEGNQFFNMFVSRRAYYGELKSPISEIS